MNYRFFLRRIGVELAAYILYTIEYLKAIAFFSPLEIHVFHQMCNAIFRGEFVARTCTDVDSRKTDLQFVGSKYEAYTTRQQCLRDGSFFVLHFTNNTDEFKLLSFSFE